MLLEALEKRDNIWGLGVNQINVRWQKEQNEGGGTAGSKRRQRCSQNMTFKKARAGA